MAKAKITEIEDLERSMKTTNAAMKSVELIVGDEKFTLITSRYSPNKSVDPTVAAAFIAKHKENLKVIGLNTTSTTLYVLR